MNSTNSQHTLPLPAHWLLQYVPQKVQPCAMGLVSLDGKIFRPRACAYAGEVECARVPGEAVAVGGAVASSAARAEALVVARRVVRTAHAQAVVVARERIDGEGCSQGHEGDSGTEEPRAGEHGLCRRQEEWHNTKR